MLKQQLRKITNRTPQNSNVLQEKHILDQKLLTQIPIWEERDKWSNKNSKPHKNENFQSQKKTPRTNFKTWKLYTFHKHVKILSTLHYTKTKGYRDQYPACKDGNEKEKWTLKNWRTRHHKPNSKPKGYRESNQKPQLQDERSW